MALAAVKISIGQSLGDGRYSAAIKGSSVPALATSVTDTATVVADMATVVTDTATLVADGASPTQAHVTTLNTDVTALNTAVGALNTDVTALNAALSGDVVVIWDGSTVTHRNQLRHALQAALRAVEGGYGGLAE